MSLAKLLAAFAIILSVAGGLSACASAPDPAPEAAPPPASSTADGGPVTENDPL
jgi:hypothetical protein